MYFYYLLKVSFLIHNFFPLPHSTFIMADFDPEIYEIHPKVVVNKEQYEAITQPVSQNVQVIAGPGTGKFYR